jgi:Kdo2-lipid IVA lauroyltransferase/acyltransferase
MTGERSKPRISFPVRCVWELMRLCGRIPFAWRWKAAQRKSRRFLGQPSACLEFARTNLAICFSESSEAQRETMLRSIALESALSFFGRLKCWSLSESELRRLVDIENLAHLHLAMARGPVILLCPHFVGLEIAGMRLNLETRLVLVYEADPDPLMDELRKQVRGRFLGAVQVARGRSWRPVLANMRKGLPLVLAPDLDLGLDSATFAPFFGVQVATSKMPARIAAAVGASILPVSIRRVQRDEHVLTIHPPLTGLCGDVGADTGRINAAIEDLIRAAPDHYWWDQPRFATRPPGESSPYSEAASRFAWAQYGAGNPIRAAPD